MGNNEIPWRMVIVGCLFFFFNVALFLEAYNGSLPDWLRFIIDGAIVIDIIGGFVFFIVKILYKFAANTILNSMSVLPNGIEEPESVVLDAEHGSPIPINQATLLRAFQSLAKDDQTQAVRMMSKYFKGQNPREITETQAAGLVQVFSDMQQEKDFGAWKQSDVDAFNQQVQELLPLKDSLGKELHLALVTYRDSESHSGIEGATRGKRIIVSQRELMREIYPRQTWQYVLGGYPRRAKWAPVNMGYIDTIRNQPKRTPARFGLFGKSWIEENQDIDMYMITGSTQITIDKMNSYANAFNASMGVPKPGSIDILKDLIKIYDVYELQTKLEQAEEKIEVLEEGKLEKLIDYIRLVPLNVKRKSLQLSWPIIAAFVAVLFFIIVLVYVFH